MNTNNFQCWQPNGLHFGEVMVERIVDDENNILSIEIKQSQEGNILKAKIIFDPYVAFRCMNESFRAKTFAEKGGFSSSLFEVKNSTWLEWLHEESLGYYKDSEITHYAIITGADCIDILSEFPPEVQIINE